MFTRQELFNEVWKRALTGIECVDEDDDGLYSDGKGNKCFIGEIMMPMSYDPRFEGHDVLAKEIKGIETEYPVAAACGYSATHEERMFLKSIQDVHDCVEPEEWQPALCNIARRYDLEVPE